MRGWRSKQAQGRIHGGGGAGKGSDLDPGLGKQGGIALDNFFAGDRDQDRRGSREENQTGEDIVVVVGMQAVHLEPHRAIGDRCRTHRESTSGRTITSWRGSTTVADTWRIPSLRKNARRNRFPKRRVRLLRKILNGVSSAEEFHRL